MTISRRFLKRDVVKQIKKLSLPDFLAHIEQYPNQALVHSIMTCLCSSDPKIRWHAISAFGIVIQRLANEDMEKARIVMRRCMWMLNDESGGIGWGIPEAFAEAIYQHSGLAEEYTHILVSFMREDGFYLELELLQRGLIWGIGRVAEKRSELLLKKNGHTYLIPYLNSKDLTVRGLAARAAGLLAINEVKNKLQSMKDDTSNVELYDHGILANIQISELSAQAVNAIS